MVATSPYSHFALVVTLICAGAWLSTSWSDLPLAVLPSLLGFSLAAYALLLAFGDDQFRSFLALPSSDPQKANDPALLLKVSAIFLHFLVIQIAALTLAIIGHAHPSVTFGLAFGAWIGADVFQSFWFHVARNAFAFVGFFTFILSIATALAAALNIYHATKWYVEFKRPIK
jgi:hypothetical protein